MVAFLTWNNIYVLLHPAANTHVVAKKILFLNHLNYNRRMVVSACNTTSLLAALPVAGGLELDDPWGPFQTKPFCDSIIHFSLYFCIISSICGSLYFYTVVHLYAPRSNMCLLSGLFTLRVVKCWGKMHREAVDMPLHTASPELPALTWTAETWELEWITLAALSYLNYSVLLSCYQPCLIRTPTPIKESWVFAGKLCNWSLVMLAGSLWL